MIRSFHHYFLLRVRPWPLVVRINSFNVLFSFLIFIKFNFSILFILNLCNVIVSSFLWWILYRKELNLEGCYSFNLESGLKFSILLFISSEVFFFFSFFWSYFHYFLSPNIEIGLFWPTNIIEVFDFRNVPIINTLVLLTSGVAITVRHNFLIQGKLNLAKIFILITIFLGVVFSILQAIEYSRAFFRICDCTFGSSFFVLTGFHGIHVLIGTVFLLTSFLINLELSSIKREWLRFELASWYWHFVDVIWIFLYFILYYINR